MGQNEVETVAGVHDFLEAWLRRRGRNLRQLTREGLKPLGEGVKGYPPYISGEETEAQGT